MLNIEPAFEIPKIKTTRTPGLKRKSAPKKNYNHEERVASGRKGGKAKRTYKRRKPKPFVPREYKPKKFVAWDGEGISPDPDRWQNYVVFGHSEGDFIVANDLRTTECLQFIVDTAVEYPNAKHVIFGMDYDVNMILRDLPKNMLRNLHKTGEIWNWKGFHIEYIPKKIFKVWKHKSWEGPGAGKELVLYDVFTFFSVSFVKALRQYNAIPESDIAIIERGKDHRGDFTYEEVEPLIIPYWKLELGALVRLCEKLEESLSSALIDLDKYHGPGAVADFLLTKHNTGQYMPGYTPNKELQHAIQTAYAGGRFEQFHLGTTHERVYQYDIRSAYPAAIQSLPDLSTGIWTFHKATPPAIHPYSLYKIRSFRNSDVWTPGPLFYRLHTGNILFPCEIGSGWYYGVELIAALDHGHTFDIEEYWELEYDDRNMPFGWVPDLYDQRAIWKRIGNPAEKAAKLGINSLYGKFAQRVGGYDQAPRWHTLEWAGMVTAHTRSTIYRAMMQAPDQIIACETDSITSFVPLNLPISEGLGDWEAKEFTDLTYLQSGVYFIDQRKDDTKANKFRGLATGSLSFDAVQRYLSTPNPKGIPVTVRRFRTMGTSLIQYYKEWPGQWCQWHDIEKVVNPLSLKAKRIHVYCEHCKRDRRAIAKDRLFLYEGQNYLNDSWHENYSTRMHRLHINTSVDTYSQESATHKLEWIDGEGWEGDIDNDYTD